MDNIDTELLTALWDGPNDGREERVGETLERFAVGESQRQIVLTKVLPIIPEFRSRRYECGGAQDALWQFKKLLSEVLYETAEFPNTINELIAEINRRVTRSYEH